MEDNTVVKFAGLDAIPDPLTDLLRTGARQLLMHAIEAEVQEHMAHFSGH